MSDPNLYEVLGLRKDADAEAIKKAYRKKSMQHHPDHGGDRNAFALVCLAGDVLRDQARRAKYDHTGDPSKKSEMAEILEVISAALDFVVGAAAQQNIEIEFVQMIPTLISRLAGMLEEVDGKLAPPQFSIQQHMKLIDRFSTDAGPNALDEMIRVKIGQLEASIEPLLHRREIIGKARAMLGSYRYRADEMTNFYPAGGFTFANAFQGT